MHQTKSTGIAFNGTVQTWDVSNKGGMPCHRYSLSMHSVGALVTDHVPISMNVQALELTSI